MPQTVTIQEQHPDHANGLFEALRDPAIYAHLDEDPPTSVTALKRRIERLAKGGPADRSEIWLNWTAFAGQTIVGYTQATLTATDKAHIAYVFSPHVWGKGVAGRAVELTISELANMHGVRRLLADTEQRNHPSQRLLSRLGFEEERRDGNSVHFQRSIVLF